MMFPSEVFREYDVRGLVDTQLTEELAYALGRAVGTFVRRGEGRQIVVGRDHRPSGEKLARALSDGILATGCDVIDIGVAPTPVQYWAIMRLGAHGGVQVTGSHNPPEYNGFKMTLLGRSLHGADIQGLRETIDAEDFEVGQGAGQSRDVRDEYVDDLAALLVPPARTMKVVVDAGNGTGGLTAIPLYERLGYEVVPLYCEPDGAFPNHHPDPTVEENLEDLRRAVAEHDADIGFAFDGDADRIGVIDRRGEVVWGDHLLILLARDVLAQVPGAPIIGEVKCSKTLYDDIVKHGGRPIMWKAGHSLIKAKIKELDAPLAGEMSGHIFFAHRYYGFDDAVYAGGRLLELLSRDSKSVIEHLADIPAMVSTPEIRMDCPESVKFALVERVTEALRQAAEGEGFRVIDVDGVRAEWADGWGLVRASNTQAILVLRFEAETRERLDAIRRRVEGEIERQRAELNA